jgi:hypothetical protein
LCCQQNLLQAVQQQTQQQQALQGQLLPAAYSSKQTGQQQHQSVLSGSAGHKHGRSLGLLQIALRRATAAPTAALQQQVKLGRLLQQEQ